MPSQLEKRPAAPGSCKCPGCLVQVSVEDRTVPREGIVSFLLQAAGCVYLVFKPDLSECDCIAAKQGMVY